MLYTIAYPGTGWVGGDPSVEIPWGPLGPTAAGSIYDDQPDPGGTGQPHNFYGNSSDNPVGAGNFNFETGIGGCNCHPQAGIGGGLGAALIELTPYWGLDIGTTITFELPTLTGPYQYAAAVGYAFADSPASAVNFQPNLNSLTLNPSDNHPCNGTGSPLLGDIVFDDFPSAFPGDAANESFVALIGALASAGTISDTSGRWGSLDTGGSTSLGMNWAAFLAEGDSIDTTQQYVTFDPVVATNDSGIWSMLLTYGAPIPPATGIPILRGRVRLSE